MVANAKNSNAECIDIWLITNLGGKTIHDAILFDGSRRVGAAYAHCFPLPDWTATI